MHFFTDLIIMPPGPGQAMRCPLLSSTIGQIFVFVVCFSLVVLTAASVVAALLLRIAFYPDQEEEREENTEEQSAQPDHKQEFLRLLTANDLTLAISASISAIRHELEHLTGSTVALPADCDAAKSLELLADTAATYMAGMSNLQIKIEWLKSDFGRKVVFLQERTGRLLKQAWGALRRADIAELQSVLADIDVGNDALFCQLLESLLGKCEILLVSHQEVIPAVAKPSCQRGDGTAAGCARGLRSFCFEIAGKSLVLFFDGQAKTAVSVTKVGTGSIPDTSDEAVTAIAVTIAVRLAQACRTESSAD